MAVNAEKVGGQIATLRKAKHLTQAELGERLGVSFQAVSKWERGETLPDIGLLPDLAAVLETTADNILNGGEKVMEYRGVVKMADMREGILCFKRMRDLLGRDNYIWQYAVQGIDEHMNTEIESYLDDDYSLECFIAEAVIARLMNGAYVDLTDVKNNFKHSHLADVVCEHAAKYGIK